MHKTETYSPSVTAKILGIGRVTVLRHIEAGLIPAIRIGRRLVIPRTYVDGLFSEAGCPRLADG